MSPYHPRQWVGLSAFQPRPLTQVVLTFPTRLWHNTKSGRSRKKAPFNEVCRQTQLVWFWLLVTHLVRWLK